MKETRELVEVMERLRKECPWDKEQTLESLKPFLIEEAYEVLEAIDEGYDKLEGELGDLLLQVVFQSAIAKEDGAFTFEDVARGIKEKLIRRHPHIFLGVEASTKEEVEKNWDEIKSKEKEHRHRTSILDGIPKNFPPLLKAQKIQKKVSKVGFDWDNPLEALERVREELNELEEAIKSGREDEIKEELGDLIFATINVGRLSKINSESALQDCNNKFMKRFKFIEENCSVEKASIDEMEGLWKKAKEEL